MITNNDVFRAERCGQTVHLEGRELWRASQESPKRPLVTPSGGDVEAAGGRRLLQRP